MQNFYRNVAIDDVDQLEQASKLMFELRERRLGLLRPYGVDDAAALLELIRSGRVAAHPAYGHYLSAQILAGLREAVRAELAESIAPGSAAAAAAPPPLHADLHAAIEARYGKRFSVAPQLMQDALIVQFDTGLALEMRLASADEYAFMWHWGEAELSIDTAPSADGLPSHLHDEEGQLRADPLTVPGKAPWANVQGLLDALLRDPLLGG
jgi:hypothetical protein